MNLETLQEFGRTEYYGNELAAWAERKAELSLRIIHEAPRELVAELPKIIEAAYWVDESEYVKFLDAQQAINLRLLEEFARRGVALACPTRYLART